MKTSHLNALRALEATLRCGNFRAAAEDLGVTAAAVGQQVATLEAYVGRQLFTRSPTGAAPTEEAARLSTPLTSSFQTLSDVMETLRDPGPQNRLALTLSDTFARNWLTPRLSRFYELGLQVDFRIDTRDRFVNLYTEDIDLAIRFGPAPPEGHTDIVLFGEHVLPVCAPEFAKKHKLGEKTRDLGSVPLLHLQEWTKDPNWPDWTTWASAFGMDGIDQERGLNYYEISFGLRAAIAGNGLALSGFLESYNALNDGRLVAPFGQNYITRADFAYRMVAAKGHRKSDVQKAFEEWILKEAAAFREELKERVGAP